MNRFWALLLSGVLVGQTNIGTWRSYTSMRSVRGLASSPNSIPNRYFFAATEGGIFQFDGRGDVLEKLTNADGLLSNNTSAVAFDGNGGLWAGGVDGSLNFRSAPSEPWHTLAAIKNSSYTNKQIQQLYPYGDSMFVVSQFGVSVYRIGKEEFGDTYANFGFGSTPIVSRTAITGGRIWVGTAAGIAVASLSAANLSAPNAWTNYTTANGLPSANITELAVFHDTLVAATTNGVAYFSGSSFQSVASFAGKLVLDLESSSTKLYALYNPNGVVVESIAGLTAAPQLVAQLNGVSGASLKVLDSGGSSLVAVGTTNNGVQMWDASSWSSILPNAPLSNLFISLAVDRNGALWCGTGMSSGAKGFYRFDPSKSESLQWKNFSTAQYPVMRGDAYYKASIGVAGSVWMSSWGYGVAEVVGDQIVRVLDSTSTPKVQSVDNTSHFPVPGGVAVDAAGSQWIAIRTAYDGNSLVKLNPDNSFSYIRNGYNAFDTYFHSLVIDRNGTKWFGNSEPDNKNARGLYYYNESNIVSGTSAFGGWGFISTSDGLPHNTVIALAVDLEGDVWVGTDLGCMIILNPLSPRLASNRQTVFALREQSIQTIAVDAVDNKWVGTREGVFVMNPDGTQLLEQYRVENTDGKLLDNDVRSIAIDQKRGVVYIGTQKGLSSLSIAAVQTQRSFATIDVAPNPFLIPEMAQVAILNLVANSSVKILNTNGTLVQQFKAQGGGRAFWDGRDSFGNLVGSGVYFIVAYAENGNQVASGKVAVILK